MSRRAFFAAYVCLVVAKAAMLIATGNAFLVDAFALLPWFWMASRRLHDFNARWWWALVPFAAGFAWGFMQGFGERLIEGLASAQTAQLAALSQSPTGPHIDWAAVAQHPGDFAIGFVRGFWGAVASRAAADPVGFGLDAAFLLVLMLWPGTRGPNRFGDRPGTHAATSA
ncbi:DUF805 domain-containing protein [Vitreimonas sp.]|uniref:DUF805 domain-containing protein n=1 Tax=Vitreimonas sp. TaxID=3069702 RepID=UPI0039C986DA